ncbi:MAG: DUF3108 domain-containing protein [Gemmatirosa sp.]
MREIARTRTDARTALARAAGLLAATITSVMLGAQGGPAAVAPMSVAPRMAVESLPFGVGERMTYRTRVAKLGNVGSGVMWIEGPSAVRGQATYHLHFDFDTRVGPVRVVNRTESWLDPAEMRSLRFHKHERHPLSKHDQRVELYPDERRWDAADGSSGATATDAPLDELSYLYFIRTLPLIVDSTYRFDRHFEAGRNPTTVRAVGREPVVTPAGTFRTLLVEMRVKDARRYKGDGVLWINLTDDACRIPVRIQSQMPVVGATVLTLESHTHAAEHQAHGAP